MSAHLDPTSLRLFVRVAELGTIAAAAEREHLSAAAVSKRLSEIEGALHTPVLTRTNKGVEPTAAGRALLALARSALHELDQVSVQMQDYASGVRGLVRLTASMSALTQFLPGHLQGFLAAHPEVQLQIDEKTSSQIPKAVAENATDIGIYLPVQPGPPLQTFAYASDRLVLVTAPGHALARHRQIALADTLAYDFVGLHTGSAINTQLAGFTRAAQRSWRLRMQVTSFDALCLMVSAGMGVAVLPQVVAERNALTTPLALVALTDASAQRDFLIGVRSLEALPRAAQLLVEHLRAAAG
ncbi:LysR family transcriptional regulator [Xylophilus sp. GOD-11R]|uniref:LysR family transcriptional regulator n=1 Tax=Xylophilus sp. GOD-11R TaxID=3089814 RepID=UPI00298D4A03|nr:LysR family transcriptional regulator [Xylophilus sp. GOD-11R]WPB55521.1 LysR family transcriptional regulator [Xylophilus sp. GOD-11R]